MSESFSFPRLWRRYLKGKLVGMEGTEPITLVGSGSMSREQAFLCISRDLGEVSGREGHYLGSVTKRGTWVGPKMNLGPVNRFFFFQRRRKGYQILAVQPP